MLHLISCSKIVRGLHYDYDWTLNERPLQRGHKLLLSPSNRYSSVPPHIAHANSFPNFPTLFCVAWWSIQIFSSVHHIHPVCWILQLRPFACRIQSNDSYASCFHTWPHAYDQWQCRTFQIEAELALDQRLNQSDSTEGPGDGFSSHR